MDKGLFFSWKQNVKVRVKKIFAGIDNYIRKFGKDQNVREVRDFFREIKKVLPDYFEEQSEAQVKINNLIGKNAKKKKWFEALVLGKGKIGKNDKVSKILAYERVEFYDKKAIAEGFVKADIKMDHKLKLGKLTVWTLRVGADLNASNTITVYTKPDGEPAVEIEVGANVLASDQSRGWFKIAYADEEGELKYGYVLGPYVGKFVEENLGTEIPKRMSSE